MVALPKAVVSAELSFGYQINLNGEQNLDLTKPLVQKIFVPEFIFLTDNYFSPGASLVYEIPLEKIFNKYFIKTDFDLYHSDRGQSRTLLNFSTGIIF
jgi:hypothetical protein